jgi:hypothetical protein
VTFNCACSPQSVWRNVRDPLQDDPREADVVSLVRLTPAAEELVAGRLVDTPTISITDEIDRGVEALLLKVSEKGHHDCAATVNGSAHARSCYEDEGDSSSAPEGDVTVDRADQARGRTHSEYFSLTLATAAAQLPAAVAQAVEARRRHAPTCGDRGVRRSSVTLIACGRAAPADFTCGS